LLGRLSENTKRKNDGPSNSRGIKMQYYMKMLDTNVIVYLLCIYQVQICNAVFWCSM